MKELTELFWGENDPIITAFWEIFVNRIDFDYDEILNLKISEYNTSLGNNKKENLLAGFTVLHLFDKILEKYPNDPSGVITKSAHVCEAIRNYFYYLNKWKIPNTGFDLQCLKLRNVIKDEYHPFIYAMISTYTLRNKFEGTHLKPNKLKIYEAKLSISNIFWIIVNFYRCLGFGSKITDSLLSASFEKMNLVLREEIFDISKLYKIDSTIDRILIIVKNMEVENIDQIISIMKDFGCKKIPSKRVISSTLNHKQYKHLFNKNNGIKLTRGSGIDHYNKTIKKWNSHFSDKN